MRAFKMEPITIGVVAGLTLSSLLFAQDVMAQTYGTPQCENVQFVEGKGAQPLTGIGDVMIHNTLNRTANITYTFKICTLEDYSCGTTFTKTHAIPNGNTFRHAMQLQQTVKFGKYGDYHYTVSVDITGDINEHTEKTCGIHIRKNN